MTFLAWNAVRLLGALCKPNYSVPLQGQLHREMLTMLAHVATSSAEMLGHFFSQRRYNSAVSWPLFPAMSVETLGWTLSRHLQKNPLSNWLQSMRRWKSCRKKNLHSNKGLARRGSHSVSPTLGQVHLFERKYVHSPRSINSSLEIDLAVTRACICLSFLLMRADEGFIYWKPLAIFFPLPVCFSLRAQCLSLSRFHTREGG